MAVSEDGALHKYDSNTGKLLHSFLAHGKTVTWFVAVDENTIYSVALDGFLKKINIEVRETRFVHKLQL